MLKCNHIFFCKIKQKYSEKGLLEVKKWVEKIKQENGPEWYTRRSIGNTNSTSTRLHTCAYSVVCVCVCVKGRFAFNKSPQ